jgi:hypothetical protein
MDIAIPELLNRLSALRPCMTDEVPELRIDENQLGVGIYAQQGRHHLGLWLSDPRREFQYGKGTQHVRFWLADTKGNNQSYQGVAHFPRLQPSCEHHAQFLAFLDGLSAYTKQEVTDVPKDFDNFAHMVSESGLEKQVGEIMFRVNLDSEVTNRHAYGAHELARGGVSSYINMLNHFRRVTNDFEIDHSIISPHQRKRLAKKFGKVDEAISIWYKHALSAPYQEGMTVTINGQKPEGVVQGLHKISSTEHVTSENLQQALARRVKEVRDERSFYQRNKGVINQGLVTAAEGIVVVGLVADQVSNTGIPVNAVLQGTSAGVLAAWALVDGCDLGYRLYSESARASCPPDRFRCIASRGYNGAKELLADFKTQVIDA